MEKKKIHFPNASGKSSPLFPKAMSPLTVMWRNWRIARAARQVGGVLKRLPEGSTLPGTGWLIATAQFR